AIEGAPAVIAKRFENVRLVRFVGLGPLGKRPRADRRASVQRERVGVPRGGKAPWSGARHGEAADVFSGNSRRVSVCFFMGLILLETNAAILSGRIASVRKQF